MRGDSLHSGCQFGYIFEMGVYGGVYSEGAYIRECINGILQYLTCAFFFLTCDSRLLPCGYKVHAPAVYLHLTFTVPPIGGTFRVQSNICSRAFLAEIINVLRLLAIFAKKPSISYKIFETNSSLRLK